MRGGCWARRWRGSSRQAVQGAFIPGRSIKDNVALLLLLPAALRRLSCRREGLEAPGLALLDFRKAYDTVCRVFLLAVMRAMGAGPGLVAWTRLLLTDTHTAAVINGHVSAPAVFAAGVRQGCPLAPALYLFVAEALTAWLRECPEVGLTLAEDPPLDLHSSHFVDDAQVALKSLLPQAVGRFLSHMGT